MAQAQGVFARAVKDLHSAQALPGRPSDAEYGGSRRKRQRWGSSDVSGAGVIELGVAHSRVSKEERVKKVQPSSASGTWCHQCGGPPGRFENVSGQPGGPFPGDEFLGEVETFWRSGHGVRVDEKSLFK